MPSVSSNLLRFSVDLISRNEKKSGGVNHENMGGDLILESPVLPKIALLTLQCEVSLFHARGTSFLFPETEVLLDEFFEPNETILPLPSSEELSDDQLKSIHELFRSCQVFELLLVVHCVLHLLDFHGSPEILHTIQKPVYERDHCCQYNPVLSAGKFLPVLKQNLMFDPFSITTNCHNDLHGAKSSTRLSMNDKREK
jgi:hypothetical protein